jgi:hypothetical protein
MLLIHQIPAAENFMLNIGIQSLSYGVGFYLLLTWLNPAPEILDHFKAFGAKYVGKLFKKG